MSDITLYQFASSHYNEKARWALDWKAVPHERVSLLPGPHMLRIRKLTGRTQTPVLVDGERIVPDSAAILAHLEQRFPEPPLVPADPADRQRAFGIATRFDAEVGPAVRLAKFFDVMNATYAAQAFCDEQSALTRAVYRASFPIVAGVMKRSMGIDADNAVVARERTRQALDFVAKESQATGYLAGGDFCIADLTCAALLMPTVDLSDLGGPLRVDTDEERRWLARWADHPGVEWVRGVYRRHRTR